MNIINFIQPILIIIFGGLAAYFKVNKSLTKKAGNLINKAEEKFTSNTEKFDWCVDMLYSYLPQPFRSIVKYFPKDILERMIQKVFDDLKTFAVKKIDKMADKAEDKLDEIQSIFVENPDMEESELDTVETK